MYNVLNDFAILLTFVGERFAVFSSSAFPFEHPEIVGEHAFVRSEELSRVVHSPGLEQEVRLVDYRQAPHVDRWGYREEDRRFISACLGEAPPAVDVPGAYRVIELCEACYLSAANGGVEVRLPLT